MSTNERCRADTCARVRSAHPFDRERGPSLAIAKQARAREREAAGRAITRRARARDHDTIALASRTA
ncbi:hypothetical protein [Nocardia cyriacigeorgica]|uniref:hypothetical protein n=1 Tax=Nocardia cyriacigeorgica TaxID=135487 RepID=UPI00245749C6|nr:hypothetical protein [Nocardia cyriacigeorgica]